MSARDGYEAGVPCWVDTWQHDPAAAVAFYTQLFGWEAEDTMPPGIPGRHFVCRLRGRDVAAIASRPEGAPIETAWNTYVGVDSVDDVLAKVVAAGGGVVKQPFDSLDGGRIALVRDPAGAVFGAWQPGTHKGAQLVNEPGAWAMSMLATADNEGAKRFYGAVFGWDTETFDARLQGRRRGRPRGREVVGEPADRGALSGGELGVRSEGHHAAPAVAGDAEAVARCSTLRCPK